MHHIADVIRRPLRWSQPGMLEREYELRWGADLVATLSFRSPFGSLAAARSAADCSRTRGEWTVPGLSDRDYRGVVRF